MISDEAAPTLHFWYDFSSPFSYLASTQIERVAARNNANLVWRPMLLGALFREIGTPNVPLLAASEAKRRWSNVWRVHVLGQVLSQCSQQQLLGTVQEKVIAGQHAVDEDTACLLAPSGQLAVAHQARRLGASVT